MMVCYGADWNESMGIPTSEPPPPYSPPRKNFDAFRQCEQSVVQLGKSLKSTLNHGPSSAFAPPPPRLYKECQPPPYSSLPTYRIQSPTHQQHHQVKHITCRSPLTPTSKSQKHSGSKLDYSKSKIPENNHPKGPVLRIGKSLEIPKSSLLKENHSHLVTSHKHPNKYHNSPSKTPNKQESPLKPKLAYIGIATKSEKKIRSKSEKEIKKDGKDGCRRSKSHDRMSHPKKNIILNAPAEYGKIKRSKPPPIQHQWKVDLEDSMLAARAQPAHTVFQPEIQPSPYIALRYEEDIHSLPDIIEGDSGGRLRSCRSLDELSDLLDEESNSLRFGSRSLDDLMEPLYENVSFCREQTEQPTKIERTRHRSQSSILDAPKVPPRTQRDSPSGKSKTEEAGDIGIQLKRLKEIARVLGVKIQRGELLSTSSSLSRSSCTENHSSKLRSAFALIDNTLHSSIRSPPHRNAPGVPARAPVINDVSMMLNNNKSTSAKPSSPVSQEDLPFSIRDQYHHPRSEEYSPSSRSPETDCGSQESGYNSVDSRSYISKHNRETIEPPPLTDSIPNSINQRPIPQTCNQRDQFLIKDNLRHIKRIPYGIIQSEPLSLPCMNSQSYSVMKAVPQISMPLLKSRLNNRTLSPSSPCEMQPIKPIRKVTSPSQEGLQNKGENQDQLGIYIKSVVSGGAADQDGRLQAGDQLLSVDGKSLVGISQEEAAQYMVGTGPIVTLEVARQGALFHGLAPLLSQPSPQVNNNRVEIRRASHPLDHRKESHRLEDKRRPPLPIPNTVPRLNKPPLSPPAAYTMVNSKSSPNLATKQVPSPGVQDPRREPQPPPNFNQPSYSPSQHPAMQSRMQASKSVPSLNSDSSNANIKGTAPAEGFNQAYSRASSATSLAHNHHYPMRSRSTQNLNEGGPLTLSGRHPSSPSLNNEDDRHYQNVSFHQGPQDPRMGSQRGGRPPMFSTNSGGAPDQRPVSAFMQREDPMQRPSEAMHRPMSQQNIRQDPRFDDPRKRDERVRYNGHHVSHSVPIGPNAGFPHGQMPNTTSNMQMRPQLRGGPLKFAPAFQGQMSPHGPPPGQMSPHGPPPGQMSPHGPPPGQMSPHGPPPGQMSPHGPPPGQMSPHGPPPGQMYPHGPPGQLATQAFYSHSPADNIPPQMSPQYANSPQNKYPPPTAPKPNRGSGSFDAPEKPSRMDAFRPNGPPRPPLPEDGIKRESPPPPPPPTSTHPLLQSPNGGVMREEVRKREAARRWRDEQICVLENQERKTPQEHEKMNTLRLEREFQKRAEAAHREDEEEDDDDEDEDDDPREEIHWGGPPNEGGGRKADEIRRKQQELEVAKEAEERILREAQRRQEEEMRHRHHATKRLDSLLVTSESNGTSPLPPERGSSYSVMHHQSAESKAPPVKRVQFSENSHNITYDNNANHEKNTVREDPNNFINEAELMLNASPNRSGNTPGVIGAQEVYRDPRQRRLLEQAQKAAATRPAGPEKLTFREKMKMFAMETEDSPKDKAKHSKAQREIEQ